MTAGSLEAGDVLRTQDGKDIVIDKVEFEQIEEPVKVYNFEVEDFHTYFVSGTPVLVHNNCVGGAPEKEVQEFIRKFNERYPGREYQSGHHRLHSDGRKLEIDFETDNAIIEFKAGNGNGLTRQVKDRMDSLINPLGKIVIGVPSKKFSFHAKNSVEKVGGLFSHLVDDILDLIEP